MREASDKSKIKKGRGVITEESYEAWKRANEAKSIGTASLIHDPVSGRSVSVLSRAEKKFFWMLRFSSENIQIYDQFPLNSSVVDMICRDLGIPEYNAVLSTDFLVQKEDGGFAAFSIKANRSEFTLGHRGYKKKVIRQVVEKRYWQCFDVPFSVVFGDELGDLQANNIENVMRYWDRSVVTDSIAKLKYLIAHHVIEVPMEKTIRFGDMAKNIDVEGMYDDACKIKQHNTNF